MIALVRPTHTARGRSGVVPVPQGGINDVILVSLCISVNCTTDPFSMTVSQAVSSPIFPKTYAHGEKCARKTAAPRAANSPEDDEFALKVIVDFEIANACICTSDEWTLSSLISFLVTFHILCVYQDYRAGTLSINECILY